MFCENSTAKRHTNVIELFVVNLVLSIVYTGLSFNLLYFMHMPYKYVEIVTLLWKQVPIQGFKSFLLNLKKSSTCLCNLMKSAF